MKVLQDQWHCPFIDTYFENHRPNQAVFAKDDKLTMAEEMFLSIFQIGIFETYEFLYQHCRDAQHFRNWLIQIRGKDAYLKSVQEFNHWFSTGVTAGNTSHPELLSDEEMDFWMQNGYLRLSGLVSPQDCDEVVSFMKNLLGINDDPASWYHPHELLQGMMLQHYQADCIRNIRYNPNLKTVFTQLYSGQKLMANTDKLSYNPPENNYYRFPGTPLHWDINFNRGIQYHIQGLIYLNDVPAERGALSLIPGFHHEIETFLSRFSNPNEAIEKLRTENREIAIAGKKGDLIVWLEALPHAATPNRSDQPRFVQYVNFAVM